NRRSIGDRLGNLLGLGGALAAAFCCSGTDRNIISLAGALLYQRKLDFIQRNGTVCFLIELIKNGNSTFGIAAADDEFFTTTKYRDIQCRRNLTQVLVHRSAQV